MQFDVYLNQNAFSKERYPYLLDVQTELLDSLETRVVVPLAYKVGFPGPPISRLMPSLRIADVDLVMVTPQLAAISRRDLGDKTGNLSEARQDIIAALDLLLTGV